MIEEKAQLLSNESLGESLYLMRVASAGIAGEMRPGQFVHMSVPTLEASILRRPFSVYDVDLDLGTMDILYQVVGKGTGAMASWQEGQEMSILGPIGRTWDPGDDVGRALLIGGGVGAAPLFMLARELVSNGVDVDVVLGAATASALACRDRYSDVCGDSVRFATDDGSFGTKGFATVHVEAIVSEDPGYDYAAICGPEPMMRAASQMTLDAGIRTEVSLERRMACGIGACLSCTCDTREGRKRACIDGPVFEADEVEW